MLFGDVKGFSRLVEEQVPAFVAAVLGAFGRVLDQFAASVDERNTWGDGVYLVVRDTAIAARCALALQEAMAGVDLAASGLPPFLGLRLAGHVGPVYSLADAVAGRASHFGTHVTRTARIEPVTPEGDVFVTEAFAAELALDDPSFRCDYVGNMPAAKGFGAMRMHSLKRTAT
jgi:class 3 adenylate cyclase